MTYLNAAIALVAAYLLGSIPFGLIAGKLTKGIDIRDHGSRNLGATNAFRTLGPVPGILTLIADGAVLTQEAGELTVEPGSGIHERLVWCDNPNLSWLPAHPIS